MQRRFRYRARKPAYLRRTAAADGRARHGGMPRFLQQILQAAARPWRPAAVARRPAQRARSRSPSAASPDSMPEPRHFFISSVAPSSGNVEARFALPLALKSAAGSRRLRHHAQFAAETPQRRCAPRSMAMPVARGSCNLAHAFRESRLVRHRHAVRAEKISRARSWRAPCVNAAGPLSSMRSSVRHVKGRELVQQHVRPRRNCGSRAASVLR